MQRYAEKLGYAVNARNEPLASFYLHEVDELTERIGEEVPEYEGYKIAELLPTLFSPSIAPLESALASGDWDAVDSSFASMIGDCNSCHAATDHSFIIVEAPTGAPPYSQRFEPPTQ